MTDISKHKQLMNKCCSHMCISFMGVEGRLGELPIYQLFSFLVVLVVLVVEITF